MIRRLPIALLLVGSIAGAEPPRRLGFADAERLALQMNARQRSTEALARASHSAADSARARYLPSLHVSEEFQHYTEPFEIAFGSDPTQPPFQARGSDTNTLAISIDQPLLGLLWINADADARAKHAEATDQDVAGSRAALVEAVRIGYLRGFEAKALEEIARSSEEQLDEQLRLTEAKLKAGVATEAELLRVRVALANAKGDEINARAQSEIARASLLGALGLDPSDPSIELLEPVELIAAGAAEVEDLAGARERAREKRAELRARRLESEAAAADARAGLYALLPSVDAEAAYVRIDGQVFAPQNSGFVGVKATWTAWEWGASWDQKEAANARQEAAALAAEAAETDIGVEVTSAIARAKAATSAVQVAEEAIAAAEEAHRETAAQLAAGTATTTNLLDAQSALTHARLNLTRARYGDAIAKVTLARATGDLTPP